MFWFSLIISQQLTWRQREVSRPCQALLQSWVTTRLFLKEQHIAMRFILLSVIYC